MDRIKARNPMKMAVASYLIPLFSNSSGLVERRQLLTNSFSQAQHSAAVRDAAARKARKQAEAEVDAAMLIDY